MEMLHLFQRFESIHETPTWFFVFFNTLIFLQATSLYLTSPDDKFLATFWAQPLFYYATIKTTD